MVALTLVRIHHCRFEGLRQGKRGIEVKGWNPNPVGHGRQARAAPPMARLFHSHKAAGGKGYDSRESGQDQRKYKELWVAKTTESVDEPGLSRNSPNAL
ncbi:hypothetical protein U1Q18_031340, partial [Sarracenia purpurea var. burkii]